MIIEPVKTNIKKPYKVKKRLVYFLLILLILSAFGAGWFVGAKIKPSVLSENSAEAKLINIDGKQGVKQKDLDFNMFWDVWKKVRENYVDQPVDETKMFYGAISGIVGSLGDPYSQFLEPESATKFTQELSGSFDGIGAEIGIKNKQLAIIAPLPESPAEKAGLRAGDKILAIDGQSASVMSLDQAVNKIRGKRGTEVALKIGRGQEEPREFKIIRDKIRILSVSFKIKPNNVAYIKLSHFNEDTFDSWQKVSRDVLSKKPKGIILDLRNNPGGFLDTAINIASYWIGPNEVVVKEKDFKGEVQSFYSRGAPSFKGIKTVVLVNEGSASGSEIVAGALQDYKVAKLIGKKTFGKGSVQDLQRLDKGAALKITIAKWLTPLGRSINEQGIDPDLVVELSDDDFSKDMDPQLDKALEEFK